MDRYYTLKYRIGTMEYEISDGKERIKFSSYEDAFKRLVEEYLKTGKMWAISQVTVSTYGGHVNTMIQPVWN